MRHWIETVKNDGLITYMVWFRERVLVTDPKTLGEVLVTKVCLSRCDGKKPLPSVDADIFSRTTNSSSPAISAKVLRGFWVWAFCLQRATSTRSRGRISCRLLLSAISRNSTRSSGASLGTWSNVWRRLPSLRSPLPSSKSSPARTPRSQPRTLSLTPLELLMSASGVLARPSTLSARRVWV